MHTAAFRAAILVDLAADLGRDDASLAEIQEFVRRALAVCEAHPEEIPDEALRPLITAHPKLAGAISSALKRAGEEKAEAEIAELRKKLSGD